MRTISTFTAAVAAGLALWAGGAAAADVKATTLRVADSFPTTHFISKLAIVPWMDAVAQRSGGKVKFEHYPNQQLGKAADLLNLTQSGVADIGYVGPSYVSDKMPLSAVAQLPGMFTTACEGSLAYWEVAKGETLTKREFASNKVRLLFGFVLEPYQFYTKANGVRTIEDVRGLKLRSTGGAMDIFARKIGAIPVRMPAPDVRESLSRGTLDGLIFPNESVLAYDLQSLVKHGTKGGNFGSFVATLVINQNVWRKIPADVQKIMDDESDKAVHKMCKEIDIGVTQAVERLQGHGVAFHQLTPAQRKPFEDVSREVAEEWAKDLDARGKPGSQVLKEFRAALAQNR